MKQLKTRLPNLMGMRAPQSFREALWEKVSDARAIAKLAKLKSLKTKKKNS
jgi:hypothetical protein